MLTLRNNKRSPLHFSDEPGGLPGIARLRRRRRLRGVGEISSTSSMKALTRPLDGTILKLPGMLDRLLHHGSTLPKGVSDEISLIKLDLNKIMAISSNLQEDDRAMMVRCWRKEVRELSYDMEDFVDQYEEHAAAMTIGARKITRRRKSKALPWLGEKLRQRLWMSNKIREFSVLVQEVLECHKLYNLDAITGYASTRCMDAYPNSWSSTPYGEENNYVGTGAAMAKLEELLMQTDDHGHQKLKVVSIVGFGGIGKTTLAKELYHKIGQQFECRAFLRTSQKPDMRRILISMLSQVCPHQPPDNWTVHSLISTIKTHLQDKRYLIIVEDLWAASTWDIVKCALPDSNCCSRIVATTEIEDLALQCCDHDPKYVYKMQPLGEDNSRKLFFSSVFGPQHECPPELMEISHDIIRKCGGLPLAIVTVASILSSRQGIQDQWDYVNKAIGYSLLTNPTLEGMKQVLGLSYNNLPQHLKACILYTGLYEEDTIIWKDDLANQWIAEGFIQATEGQDKKEVAKYFFDSLISRKLILPVDINRNGEVLSCTVHHMVLNLVIRSKSIEENFVTAIHHSQARTTIADKVRRLSLQFGNAEDAMPPTNMRLSHVRTLSFRGIFKCLPSVVQFRLLQVVILHFWGDKDSISFDINRISELFRLRYLKVTSNVTLELCTQMRGLQSLETLTIDARISAVPSDIVQLPELLHLNLPAEANLPNGIGHMTSLRSLGYFDVSSNSIENVQSLSLLTNLRDLQLTCSTIQPENLNSKMQFLLNSILGRLSNLKSLTLVPRASSHAKTINDAGATGVNIISVGSSSLSSAPAFLQSLEVSPRICIFLCTPKWMGSLHNLCVLKFGVTKIDRDNVDVLRGLPSLAVLSLYVQTKPAARIVIGKTGFPVLKYFKFKCSDPLLEFEKGAMPNLRNLKLAFNACNADGQQSTIPVGMEYLSELKEVSAKIGGVGHEESHRSAAELAFRGAIRVHARCQRVNVQCAKLIIGDTDGKSSVSGVTTAEDWSSTMEDSSAQAPRWNRDDSTTRRSQCPSDQKITATLEDGNVWRKYGQKKIQNSPYPRSYYRCAHRSDQGCTAKRHVHVCEADPSKFVVTYYGFHTCRDPSTIPLLAPAAGAAPDRGGNLISFGSGSTTNNNSAASTCASSSPNLAMGGSADDQLSMSCCASDDVFSPSGGSLMHVYELITATLEDGHVWRKYGQKEIQNSPYPRSYYRCTHRPDQGCEATRRVRVYEADPSKFVVTYYGEHTCRQPSTIPFLVPAAAAPDHADIDTGGGTNNNAAASAYALSSQYLAMDDVFSSSSGVTSSTSTVGSSTLHGGMGTAGGGGGTATFWPSSTISDDVDDDDLFWMDP